jgi:predicted PurR-regulated permease PerM
MKLVNIQLDLKNTLIIIGLLLLIFLIFKIQEILAPFAISFFIAYLLDPLVDKMEQYRINRSFSILVIFLLIAGIISVVLIFLLPVIYREIMFLIDKMPRYFGQLMELIQKYTHSDGLEITYYEVVNFLKGKVGNLSSMFFQTFASVYSSVSGVVGRIVSYSLVPILIFYFLRDFDRLMAKVLNLVEQKVSFDIKPHVAEFNSILSRYFRGQLAVSLILAVLYTVALLIAGIKGAIGIGVISGILSIVPYLGFLVGFVTSLIAAYFQYFDLWHPLYVVIGFTVVQFLESNFITPKLVGGSLGLHPTAVIFSLILGGYLLGIAGMIISLPVAAFIKVVLMNYFYPQENTVR